MEMNIETIYNNIAEEFDRTRTSLWNCVIKFLDTFPSDSKILDVGCGNDNDNKNYKRWKSVKTGTIYYRYYNFYKEGELENEIRLLKPEFKIIGGGYEKGNYYIKIQK